MPVSTVFALPLMFALQSVMWHQIVQNSATRLTMGMSPVTFAASSTKTSCTTESPAPSGAKPRYP